MRKSWILCLILLLFPLGTLAGKGDQALPPGIPRAGKISAMLSDVSVRRHLPPKAHSLRAIEDMDLTWNDVVKTDRRGRARIRLSDGSVLSIGSDSELRMAGHDAQTRRTQVELAYGLLRAQIRKLAAGEQFEVRTPTAVAGVIGTDFGIDASDPHHVKFVCLEGTVRITSLDPKHPGTVECRGGSGVTIDRGKLPKPPSTLKPEQMDRWRHITDPEYPDVE